MSDIKDIYWVAGLIEGEGCFYLRKRTVEGKRTQYRHKRYPLITVGMTDRDVIDKLASFWDVTVRTTYRYGNEKTYYTTVIGGKKAIGWMMTLYPLMGKRRREKIREVIKGWKE